jgi:hypothetical protein
MSRNILTGAVIALTALASFSVAADAQQRARTNTQARGVQASYDQATPYEHATCPIYRIWMTESGVVFHCNGIAMAFNGGNRPGGIAAAMSMLIRMQEAEQSAYVRYQIDPDNAACSEMDFTRYGGMFGEEVCARVVSFGTGL